MPLVLPAPVPLAGSGPHLPAQRALTERIPLIEQAGLSGAVRAPARPETIAPVLSQGARSAEGVEVSIVARLPDFMPAAVPHPKPKPKFKPDVVSLKTAPAAAERKKPLPVSKNKGRTKASAEEPSGCESTSTTCSEAEPSCRESASATGSQAEPWRRLGWRPARDHEGISAVGFALERPWATRPWWTCDAKEQAPPPCR